MMTLNLDDIAQLAGVSRATVSRVVNDHPDVSLITRTRVQAIIAAHKFRPNAAARMLATQRTRILGVAICNPTRTFRSDYGSILFEGITDVANKRDYATLLYWEQSHKEKSRFTQRILQQNRLMDGMLLASTDMDSSLVDELVELGIPFVMMEKPTRNDDAISYVTIENIKSVENVVDHLVGLGRRHIAHIEGIKGLIDARERVIGYRNALERHEIPYDARRVIEGSFSRESGYRAMRELIARDVPIDAVFVSNDDSAEGVLTALSEVGLRVPDDVSLVGFDDVPTAMNCIPTLTTVHQPIREKAERATMLLLDMIEGKVTEPHQVILATHLVIRESCGAKAGERTASEPLRKGSVG